VENEGRASRDFIYVDDIVRGLVLCALEGQPGDVYNLASGKETTILELAKTVNRLTGNPAPLTFLPPRDWDHAGRRFGSTDKAKRALGFEARIDLDEGLTGTIEWTKANLRRIESCMDKHKHDLERLSAGRR
jgi:UDP-glucose 4-epimerase